MCIRLYADTKRPFPRPLPALLEGEFCPGAGTALISVVHQNVRVLPAAAEQALNAEPIVMFLDRVVAAVQMLYLGLFPDRPRVALSAQLLVNSG